MNAVEVERLHLSFGGLKVLEDVSLTVGDKEFVALIGPSGCGKSTLLRVIAGIIPAMIQADFEGKITVLGRTPFDLSPGDIDMVFQEGSLLSWRNVLGNVNLGIEIIKKRSGISPLEILSNVGLSKFLTVRPGQLSGGMKQRVSLASSLITKPLLLLMDEPFANLDALTRESMWQLVERLRLKNLIGASLIVTHSIEEAVVLADRVYVMSKRPARIVGEVFVDLPKPRIKDGLFIDGFGVVANVIRAQVRTEVNNEGEKN